jgi:alkylhydroperoxidase family enzyme
MARVPLADLDPADPTLDVLRSYYTGRQMPEIYGTLANAPRLLRAWTDFAWPLRNEASSPRGLRELAIMRVAQLTGAETEWRAHAPLALAHGVTQEHLDQLERWPSSHAFDDAQRELLAFTDQLTQNVTVDDSTFAALAARWSPQEVVELTLTVAFYCCVSRVLRALDIQPPD